MAATAPLGSDHPGGTVSVTCEARMHPSPPTTQLLLLGIGLALFALAAMQDWASRLVSNRIPAGIAAVGLVLRVADGSLLPGAATALTVFAAAVLCWRRGWIGGGDVKLFGAGALLFPPHAALPFILATAIAGGILALAYAGMGRLAPAPATVRPRTLAGRLLRMEQRRLRRRGPLPYATAIAAGAVFVVVAG